MLSLTPTYHVPDVLGFGNIQGIVGRSRVEGPRLPGLLLEGGEHALPGLPSPGSLGRQEGAFLEICSQRRSHASSPGIWRCILLFARTRNPRVQARGPTELVASLL